MFRGAVLLACLAAAVAQENCAVTFADKGTSFDASYLVRTPDNAYDISDARASVDDAKKYRYRFNVCANATAPPNEGCDNDSTWPVSPGYQYGDSPATDGICYQLASPYAPAEFLPYDSYNPARGVIVRMNGGDTRYCQAVSGKPQASRYLEVALDCAPGVKDNIPDVELIYEKYACQYQIYLTSHWGCPLECMSGADDVVCSNKGVCGYNRDAKRSQCYCDSGFAGAHCEEKASTGGGGGVSTEAAFLIVACLLLAFVIAIAVFMYVKVRKLQVDPNAYENLQGRFNELGQIM